MMEREQERKRNGTDKPQGQERQLLCDLDRYMAGSKGPLGVKRARQGHRHPDASGPTYGPEMRGQRIQPPKVPSWNIKARGTV